MRSASVAAFKARFTTYLKETQNGPIVVTKNGKPVAVLVGVQDADDLERLMMAHSPELRAILDKSWKSIQQGKGIKAEKFWRQFNQEE